jgi:ABC-type multidrug transport system permease subunit
VIAYVGAAATKSVIIGLIILATSTFFTDVRILHPVWMVAFLLLTSIAFSLFGFIIGIWAKSFEQLSIIPSLIVTPLTFLGGAFYSIDMLPPHGARSACSIPSSIWSAASAGASMALAMSASGSAWASRPASWRCVWPCSGGFSARAGV